MQKNAEKDLEGTSKENEEEEKRLTNSFSVKKETSGLVGKIE